MATRRFIKTKFWSDTKILVMDIEERYLFLYFLTNEHTNISGVYEIPIRIVARETGIDDVLVEKLLKRFTKLKVAYYYKNWIILTNFIKNQVMNESVKKGISRELLNVPDEILAYIKQNIPDWIQTATRLGIDCDILNLNLTKPKLKPKPKRRDGFKLIISHYFQLKGWGGKDKNFYQKNKIVYSRFIKPAQQLLELCDDDIEEANLCLDKISEWAGSRELDWSIETVFKKWYDLDYLKPKEKKPYIDGKRAFQKNGKWFLIDRTGEIKEYVGDKNKIIMQ